ncbi:MAG: transcriptional repressor [Hyphomicrobiaceae bacterium]|nr:transcriptional repressor [Hyphomicrobiaceae bacterium]
MTERQPAAAFPPPGHNHKSCVELALERAERAFEAKGLRLTELRRRVFEEIAGSHHAIGAYDVLERLGAKGTRLAPISVYRAIDALLSAGVIHRLESRNAFFACHSAHAADRDQLILACGQCGRVAEVPGRSVFEAIGRALRQARFQPDRTVAEVTGICGDCRAR